MAARRNRIPVLPVFLVCVVAILAWGCGPAVPEYTLVQSPNGKTIKLERKTRLPLGDGSVALMLTYRTDLGIGDPDGLRAEVEEVWRTFRDEANAAGVRAALIEARELRGERWSRIGRAQRFAFRKTQQGSWALVTRELARTTVVKPL